MPVEPGGVNVVAQEPLTSVQVPGLTEPVVVDQLTVPVGVVRPPGGVDVSATVAVHVEVAPIATGLGEQVTVVLVGCGVGGGGAAGNPTPIAPAGAGPASAITAAIIAVTVAVTSRPGTRARVRVSAISPPSLSPPLTHVRSDQLNRMAATLARCGPSVALRSSAAGIP